MHGLLKAYRRWTALSRGTSVLGTIEAALQLVQHEEIRRRRQELQLLATQMRDGLRDLGLDTFQSSTQIVPILIGDDARTLKVARGLEERGFLVGAIRPPTVPVGTARLRVSLSASHDQNDVREFIAVLKQILQLDTQ